VLLALQNVRGNYARIHAALSDLVATAERVSGADQRQAQSTSIELAVEDAVAMFQRQAQGLLQVCVKIIKAPLIIHLIFVYMPQLWHHVIYLLCKLFT